MADTAPGSRKRRKPPTSMRSALRRTVLPALRERGFEGELPHLRRILAEGTHTFGVRTSKWGGRFIIELGRAPAGPYTTSRGEVVEARSLASHHLRNDERAWLRAEPNVDEEVWFRYTPSFGDWLRARVARLMGRATNPAAEGFERVARAVLAHLPECEQWWSGVEGLPYVRSSREYERLQWRGAERPADSVRETPRS